MTERELIERATALGVELEDDGFAYTAYAPDGLAFAATGSRVMVAEYDSNGHSPTDKRGAVQSLGKDLAAGLEESKHTPGPTCPVCNTPGSYSYSRGRRIFTPEFRGNEMSVKKVPAATLRQRYLLQYILDSMDEGGPNAVVYGSSLAPEADGIEDITSLHEAIREALNDG